MSLELQVFVQDGVACGGIVRKLTKHGLHTLTVFQLEQHSPDGVYLAEVRIDYEDSVFQWSRCSLRSLESEPIEVARGASVFEAAGPVIPSYGQHMALVELLSRDEESGSFHIFDETDPELLRRAELVSEGLGSFEDQNGGKVEAARYVLVIEGVRTNTHWVSDGRIIASDWAGAWSYGVRSTQDLLSIIDNEGVKDHIRRFTSIADELYSENGE